MSVSLIKDSDIHDLIEVGEHAEIIREPLSDADITKLKISLVRSILDTEDRAEKLVFQCRALLVALSPSEGLTSIGLRNTPSMLWAADGVWPTEQDKLVELMGDLQALVMAVVLVAHYGNDKATIEGCGLFMQCLGNLLAHKHVSGEIDETTMLAIFEMFNIVL